MKKLIRVTTIPLSLDKLLGEQLRFMNNHYEVIAISAEKEELKRVADKYGVSHFHIEMTRKITPVKDLLAVWKMFRFLKKEQPEILHTHTPKAGLVGMLAGVLAGVPVRAHTVAGLPLLETSGAKRKLLNAVEWLTYRCATDVYPNSYGLKDIILKEKFCRPSKLKVIGQGSSNGIDTELFNPAVIKEESVTALRQRLDIARTDLVFIFVGRLVKDKGINELVSAFTQLQHRVRSNAGTDQQNIKLLLVGPLEQNLNPLHPETLAEIEKNANIITTGYQDDVRPYFALSDVLVFPSYREGFPNVVLQAGAMELPAIVTDINGCNEIVTEGENGMIVPPKNSSALLQAMQRILDPEIRRQLKKNSRNVITTAYRRETVWKAVLEEYEKLTLQKVTFKRKE